MTRYPNAIPPARIPCPECNGRTSAKVCWRCDGKGYLRELPKP